MQSRLSETKIGCPSSEQHPVYCLGREFSDDEARRAHFTEILRERLRDPKFREVQGFPIGSAEGILNLSDPPLFHCLSQSVDC